MNQREQEAMKIRCEGVLEIAKIRGNQTGYRPTKVHYDTVVNALDHALQLLHEQSA